MQMTEFINYTPMQKSHTDAPPPDLRIVRVDSLHPHEEHDVQRAQPLIEQIKVAEKIINPPVVAPIDTSQFVVLDGANRCYSFQQLAYPHLLVQVVSYESGYVELHTWHHIVSHWSKDQLLMAITDLHEVQITHGQDTHAIAHMLFKTGEVFALSSAVSTTHERNTVLRQIVKAYHDNATLSRTIINEPQEIWPLYPDAIALVMFPRYTPADIIAAAKYKAYLPPGISRHVVHGRALRVNYPLSLLKDKTTRLSYKNEALHTWMQQKLANRNVRYYAEATYQFDE